MANGTATTDLLENLLVDLLDTNNSAVNVHSGTGTTTPATGDTDLAIPTGSRVAAQKLSHRRTSIRWLQR